MFSLYYLEKYVKNNPDKVHFYGYRQKAPKTFIMQFHSDMGDVEKFEETLYKITDRMPDNHVLFTIQIEDCTLSIMFDDSLVTLGIGIKDQHLLY